MGKSSGKGRHNGKVGKTGKGEGKEEESGKEEKGKRRRAVPHVKQKFGCAPAQLTMQEVMIAAETGKDGECNSLMPTTRSGGHDKRV